jgi:RNA polymerase sigma-70 factor (ECF subfamily)
MVSVLSRLLGLQNVETAQDIVQDTLLQAMNTWGFNGVPENPAAWLIAPTKQAVDFRIEKVQEIAPQYAHGRIEYSLTPTVHNLFLERKQDG